jgi:hypothetical protein
LVRFDGEAAIEVRDEVLLEIVIGDGIIANTLMPEFLRQASLNGAEGPLATAASWGE